MKKQLTVFGIFLSVVWICAASVNAQVGPPYEITEGLTTSGGGVAKDAASSRELTGTIAQPVAGTRSGGGAYGLWGGFWGGAPAVTTSSGVSISGRVTTAGRGLTNAAVTLTDPSGAIRTVLTGRGGSFRIDDVAPGASYVISVVSQRFTFIPQIVVVNDNVTGLELIAQ